MRELLFRGKQVTDGEWVIGGIYINTDGKPHIVGKARYRPDTRDWDTAEYYENNPHCITACIEVIPETVGQFTGMVDKNGQKIFEGDIIARENYYNAIHRALIGYDHASFVYFNTSKAFYKDIPFVIDDCEDCINEDNYEIVGNIHDNPELLDAYRKE